MSALPLLKLWSGTKGGHWATQSSWDTEGSLGHLRREALGQSVEVAVAKAIGFWDCWEPQPGVKNYVAKSKQLPGTAPLWATSGNSRHCQRRFNCFELLAFLISHCESSFREKEVKCSRCIEQEQERKKEREKEREKFFSSKLEDIGYQS